MDGTSGLVVMIVGMVLFFCVLIGGIVWLYSSQSAKRQKAGVATKDGSKEQ